MLSPLRQGPAEMRTQHASFIPLLAATGVKESEDFKSLATAKPEMVNPDPLVRAPGHRALHPLRSTGAEAPLGYDFSTPRIRWQHLDSATRAALDQILSQNAIWTSIELHGITVDSVRQLGRVHRVVRREAGHPYHVVIGDAVSLGSAAAQDGKLRICVMGDFHTAAPDPVKLAALDEIIDYVSMKTGHLKVQVHDASCLGIAFPARQIVEALSVE